jgi:hypothetical protein
MGVDHAVNVTLPAWLQHIPADDNEIARCAAQRLPIILPWGKKRMRIGTCYDSRLQATGDPFLDANPFILSDLYMISKTLHPETGTESSFNSVTTSRLVETADHLSLGFGVSVGLPFLASVSVKGQFDRHLVENNDVCMAK